MIDNLNLTAENSEENESSDINESSDLSNVQQYSAPKLRDRNTLKRPERLTDYVFDFFRSGRKANFAMIALISEIQDITISEALNDENWRTAINEEFNSLITRKTWKLVNLPEGVKPLTCRWILSRKPDGRYKARVVARGFERKEGIDYFQTFSPVARHDSIRLILSIAASKKMRLMTFDVKTAFFYGDLKENIFMYQPEGFNDGTGRVCKLEKSIYGLKQAPKNWNEKFSKRLLSLRFTNTDDDP